MKSDGCDFSVQKRNALMVCELRIYIFWMKKKSVTRKSYFTYIIIFVMRR